MKTLFVVPSAAFDGSIRRSIVGFSRREGGIENREREIGGCIFTFAIATPPLLPWLRGGAEGGGVILRN
ncbi:MAG: hypothetical protein J7641_19930 [Cyanobacteria bacterium SID2]|nr:hypothetical protein [Cyanobacteria bacterium SID2]MBP0004197.1 hypothetical protein [Cyanobacteria bacterium SBC]